MSSSLLPANSTILVTGGATGIGLGLVKQLVSKGHTVIVAGRRQIKLDEAKAEVPEITIIQGDIGSDDERIRLFQLVTKQFPDVNVLINNAGVFIGTKVNIQEKDALEEFRQNGQINTEGTIHLSYLFADYFKSKPDRKALIVIVTSIAAFIPVTNGLGYSMSKAALHHFSVGFRLLLKDTNIRVVEAFPGPVNTDMLPDALRNSASTVEAYTADVINQIELGHTEFGQTGTPFEKLSRESPEYIDGFIKAFNP
eukprot:gene20478-26568_t